MFFKQINVTRIGFANDERRATAHAIAVDVIDALRTLENVNDGVVTMVHKVDASFCSEFADAGVIKADNGVVWNADQQQMRWELFTLAEVIKLFGRLVVIRVLKFWSTDKASFRCVGDMGKTRIVLLRKSIWMGFGPKKEIPE